MPKITNFTLLWEKDVRSFFDHNLPNFNLNYEFVRYDGQKWTGGVDIGNCQKSINCYDGHNGLVIGLVYEHVLAAADGIVWKVGWFIPTNHSGSYGLRVTIRHSVNGPVYFTRYAHLTTVAVMENQFVKVGDIIGTSGSTGSSTGPHLHFDVAVCESIDCPLESNFIPIDPFGWNPEPAAPVQDDPWAQHILGAESYCMWNDGQFINLCNPSRTSHPIAEPIYGDEIVVDDTVDKTASFTKAHNGISNCTGIDPECREWWETNNVGIGGIPTELSIMD